MKEEGTKWSFLNSFFILMAPSSFTGGGAGDVIFGVHQFGPHVSVEGCSWVR
jgi:hypothetical protein